MHGLTIFLSFIIVIATAISQYLNTTGCPKCLDVRCPKSETQCLLGLTEDLCGCCPLGVCAKIEGEECYNKSLVPAPPLETKIYGLCGKNLNCLYKKHFYDWDIPHASCVCDDPQMVCSYDNVTYNSICDMKLEAAKKKIPIEEVLIKNYGPCIAIPQISNVPTEKIAKLGDNIILSCEARGYPIPVVTWHFTPLNKNDRMLLLPSDNSHITVQVRGGPDAFMSTGWLQITHLRAADVGIYTCTATNKLGYTKISARVIVKNVKDEV